MFIYSYMQSDCIHILVCDIMMSTHSNTDHHSARSYLIHGLEALWFSHTSCMHFIPPQFPNKLNINSTLCINLMHYHLLVTCTDLKIATRPPELIVCTPRKKNENQLNSNSTWSGVDRKCLSKIYAVLSKSDSWLHRFVFSYWIDVYNITHAWSMLYIQIKGVTKSTGSFFPPMCSSQIVPPLYIDFLLNCVPMSGAAIPLLQIHNAFYHWICLANRQQENIIFIPHKYK